MAAETEEQQTEQVQAGSDRISLRVVGQDGCEVFFRVRKTTPLGKLFKAYTDRKGINPTSVRFLYEGARISESDTAESLDMEENDVIDALLQQTGG